MKKITLLIIALLVSMLVFPQNDSLLLKSVNATNYCLYKFQKENKIGFATELIGAGMIVFANIDNFNGIEAANKYWEWQVAIGEQKGVESRILAERKWGREIQQLEIRNNTITYIGIGLVVAGSFIHVNSYRWLKRAYVVPQRNGVAVGVTFDF